MPNMASRCLEWVVSTAAAADAPPGLGRSAALVTVSGWLCAATRSSEGGVAAGNLLCVKKRDIDILNTQRRFSALSTAPPESAISVRRRPELEVRPRSVSNRAARSGIASDVACMYTHSNGEEPKNRCS